MRVQCHRSVVRRGKWPEKTFAVDLLLPQNTAILQAPPPPECETLLAVSIVTFGEHRLLNLPRSADRLGPITKVRFT